MIFFFKRIERFVFNDFRFSRFSRLYLHNQKIPIFRYVKNQFERQWGYEPLKEISAIRIPKNPLILCHGLLGFNKIEILKNKYINNLPFSVIHYWRGIQEFLQMNGIEVFVTSVPMMGTIEERSHALDKQIREKYEGRKVNLIAHSMGGLDCRYLISNIKPKKYQVKSLTTIMTPHRGSYIANRCFQFIQALNISKKYNLFTLIGIPTKAIEQLTTTYMEEIFNVNTINDSNVMYFSYGASFIPSFFNVFWIPWNQINKIEGMNDGLVSVRSSIWGNYKGTLRNVNHLDAINWTTPCTSMRRNSEDNNLKFNAISFYMSLAEMIAMENL